MVFSKAINNSILYSLNAGRRRFSYLLAEMDDVKKPLAPKRVSGSSK
jgi:hypothetical protein